MPSHGSSVQANLPRRVNSRPGPGVSPTAKLERLYTALAADETAAIVLSRWSGVVGP